jgi:DNA-binding MarR family transcriptional regulator
MSQREQLGALLEQFVNRISHPRGETLALMIGASVTTAQVILLHLAQKHPNFTHSELARAMKLSRSSASQMVERLVKTDFLMRRESAEDRRVRTLTVTPKGSAFLKRLQVVRVKEYAVGTEALSSATRQRLIHVISQSLTELPERTVAASGADQECRNLRTAHPHLPIAADK